MPKKPMADEKIADWFNLQVSGSEASYSLGAPDLSIRISAANDIEFPDQFSQQIYGFEESANAAMEQALERLVRLGSKEKTMSDGPSREETREIINDKLAAVEARLDAKLTGIDAKIDRISDSVARFSREIHEVKTDNKSTRTTIVVTVIVALLAAVGVIITIQIGLLTAFSSGATEHVTAPVPPAVTRP
jgi:hypothetical protein